MKTKKQKKEKISFWKIMVKSIKDAYMSYKISIQKELEKKALLSSRSDWTMLENLVKKCNENPNLRIEVFLNDGTRINMKTFEVQRQNPYMLINGEDYEDIR